ncbi:MAG: hypothetical protein ACK4ME_10935, partial [Fimbriimonadales bacterium]
LWGVCASDAALAQRAMETLCPPLNLMHLAIHPPDDAWRRVAETAQGARMALAAALANGKHTPAHEPDPDALRNAITALRGQARYWTVATQMHQAAPNHRTFKQLRQLCDIARAVDFGVVRLLHGGQSLYHQQAAYSIFDACVQADVPFEAVHLEWRWYDGSLYDLDQLLERYGELGKPLHLTLHLPPMNGFEVFTRTAPTDWTESAALIALSKPYVAALRLPLQGAETTAGALDGEPSEYWQRIAQLSDWNRSLQD